MTKTGKKRVFESKAAAVAAQRIEDEEAAMFAGASPVRAALKGRPSETEKSKPHRLTFEVDDALYYAIYQTVKRPGSRYKTISDFLREVAWRAVDEDAEA